ncbi:chromosome segregation protein SMC [Alkalilimnicola ehrlichii MLHE-1]|uniref:Chromosome partition protein Smc n=1 Tax=Alkalilimnicola ehrlichii (strain ATCC BAA-1101 / DSM 17681 / MLHE-1) TaxID=187272 RepID=Q0AAV4_ALKEH|nr:chromosome segregation protein SMC [Alkalilimnicola ehrlichii]ABI56033.1 chromosome segregation protein SMC [Alkalilimnicola ehrlichii MLHE-1]
MRLKKIKLSGFKSFVDPTQVAMPGDLVAVVGPNGCGKSNIIDAVRWVMGESSARHLRGQSMADVIFNGSTARKPVSHASVELVFDNSDGRLGGQYAQYGEIAVRRQVNREGQSQYFLNGTRCRRKDITDVFLGTGLGPRGYTIIEQGMISRVIEARPEELRVYLEEAAGISIYKERRRETERRIRDTRENLERLEDVREEVRRQLEKLRRQAEVARRYRELKQAERDTRAELITLRQASLKAQLEEQEAVIAAKVNAREFALATQRQAEREIEAIRATQGEAGDRLNAIQADYYGVGSEIARIEQQISHRRELRDKQLRELRDSEGEVQALERGLEEDREKLALLEERLEALQPEQEEQAQSEAFAQEALDDARDRLEAWREAREGFQRERAEAERAEQVEKVRVEGLERRADELARRLERLEVEYEAEDLYALEQAIGDLEAEETELAEELAGMDEAQADVAERLESDRAQATELADKLEALRGELHQQRARLASLETLQQSALGEDGGPLEDWLSAREWQQRPRLAQQLVVTPGWERAVETVLAEGLQAVCVRPEELEGAARELPEQGDLTLVSAGAVASGGAGGGDWLADQVRDDGRTAALLAGIRCADDLPTALARRGELAAGESFITPDGVWLGANWLRLRAGDDAERGVIAREREIHQLRDRVAEGEARLVEREEAQDRLRQAVRSLEEEREALQQRSAPMQRRQADLQARIEHRRDALEAARERREALHEQQIELREERETVVEELDGAQARLAEAAARAEAQAERGAALEDERHALERAVDDAREQLRQCREARHEISLKLESASTARQALREGLDRLQAQHRRLLDRREELAEGLEGLADPGEDLEAERDELLQRRHQLEQGLAEARNHVANLEQKLRDWGERRQTAVQETETLREELEGLRITAQEYRVLQRREAAELEQLGEHLEVVASRLPEGAEVTDWEKRLEQLGRRIARLGTVNLAAIDECAALEERQQYLDAQYDDLFEALETLENAIRRIDRETRARFRDTFEQVNQGVQRLFPRLFGGGRAYLELTDDDLLATGVAVMAQPPGKRVTNIHLLSGGEKALTAVALVFAIFNLNPAPFCMLDEVDAPLDEANVGRFCEMVREMSEQVQFIVITHNKTTMEAVSHLVGVTMHEPGVSRLVAVDVAEAVELAEA